MMNTPANTPTMRRRLITEEEHSATEEQRSLGCLERLMPNSTARQRNIYYYTVLVSLTIIFFILFVTSYYVYNKIPRVYMNLPVQHTTTQATSTFGDSKIDSSNEYKNNFNTDTSTDSLAITSSTGGINETSPTADSNTSKIHHRKWNSSTTVNPSAMKLVAKLASVVNSNSSGTAFHDSSTQSVTSKTIKHKAYSNVTNKFEDISVGLPKRNPRTHKMLTKALKTNEVYPSVVKVEN